MHFATYLESLPGTTLNQLYHSLYVCLAILHGLPPLAKQYVLRMLHLTKVPAGEFPKEVVHMAIRFMLSSRHAMQC
jgi:Transcription factor Tfb2